MPECKECVWFGGCDPACKGSCLGICESPLYEQPGSEDLDQNVYCDAEYACEDFFDKEECDA
jgi:hypothetical protein